MTNTKKTHKKHTVHTSRETPFFGPVGDRENQAAHGNITIVAVCRCGAKRRTNVNGCHIERGSWGFDVTE